MRDLSLHILDIIQNSISANASRVVLKITVKPNLDKLLIYIEDNGKGMSDELLKDITDPFTTTRTTRKVGLGIPMFKASTERADGDFKINSVLGKGTDILASFKLSHIDRLPLGNLPDTIITVILSNPDLNIDLELIRDKEIFNFKLQDVKKEIGEVPVTELPVLTWIKDYINEGVKIIFGGVLDEIHS